VTYSAKIVINGREIRNPILRFLAIASCLLIAITFACLMAVLVLSILGIAFTVTGVLLIGAAAFIVVLIPLSMLSSMFRRR